MLNQSNDCECTMCLRFSWIPFTIPGMLTVIVFEFEINHSAKENRRIHVEYSMSIGVI
jgi:hypothetical protein